MSTLVGQQLRQAREARSLSLDQVSQATHIRAHYLEALEAGDLARLPSAVQARGFLRAYASFLGLDVEPVLAVLYGEQGSVPTVESPKVPDQETVHPSEVSEPAELIFSQIGKSLNRQRDLLGLSLDDVERHTHLRQHYLQALEAGNLNGLPSPVQGRGMLNNYATFLGLDPEPLLLRFADGLQARLAARQAVRSETRPSPERRKKPLPAPLRRIFSGDKLIGGALAAFLMLFIVWGAIRIFALSSQQAPTVTAPSIADVLLASPTATSSSTPAPPSPTVPPAQLLFPTQALATDPTTGDILPVTPQIGVNIYITVRQRGWMRVVVDGNVEFEGRVIPGSAHPFVGEESVQVLTGNGAALQIFFNGVDLGPMGTFGQVVDRVYGLEGILTPTPTATLRETATQPVSPTSPLSTAVPGPAEVTTPALP